MSVSVSGGGGFGKSGRGIGAVSVAEGDVGEGGVEAAGEVDEAGGEGSPVASHIFLFWDLLAGRLGLWILWEVWRVALVLVR